MSYWKWLWKSIKAAASWKRIKAVSMNHWTEYFIGLGCGYFFFVFGLFLGISEDRLYHLLLLGIIPSAVAMVHASYRREMKNKQDR